jgi:hypothetical protein
MALWFGMHGCNKHDSSAVSAKEPQKSENEQYPWYCYKCACTHGCFHNQTSDPIFTFVKIQRNMLHVCPVLTNTQYCNISEDMPYIVNNAARTLTASVT